MSSAEPFAHRVTSEAELRDLLGQPGEVARRKVIHHLDDHCRTFIARSPFVLVATSDSTGTCDVSPRGDAPGFVQVLDGQRLVIPERPGNRRVDSLQNLLTNPHIGLLFLIPGVGETLRVNGRAHITRDPALLERLQAQGKAPLLAIGVEVDECYLHCAKALLRSQLWEPGTWLGPGERPATAHMLADHARAPELDGERMVEYLQESYTKRLY